jgi:hypothetical protein
MNNRQVIRVTRIESREPTDKCVWSWSIAFPYCWSIKRSFSSGAGDLEFKPRRFGRKSALCAELKARAAWNTAASLKLAWKTSVSQNADENALGSFGAVRNINHSKYSCCLALVNPSGASTRGSAGGLMWLRRTTWSPYLLPPPQMP